MVKEIRKWLPPVELEMDRKGDIKELPVVI